MSIKTIACILCVLVMAYVVPVQAGANLYAGVGFGGISPQTNLVTDSLANTYFAVLGLQVLKPLSIEAGVLYSDWRNYANQEQKKVTNQASWSSASLSAIGYLPLANRVELFAKYGISNGICNVCANIIATHSIVRGVGFAVRSEDAQDSMVLRFGVENYAADTQLNAAWAVDHVYLLGTMDLK